MDMAENWWTPTYRTIHIISHEVPIRGHGAPWYPIFLAGNDRIFIHLLQAFTYTHILYSTLKIAVNSLFTNPSDLVCHADWFVFKEKIIKEWSATSGLLISVLRANP